MIHVEDEQLAAFAPGLDAQFRTRCVQALAQRGNWAQERLDRAVDISIGRAPALGLWEERCVLQYLLLAVDIMMAKPPEHVGRAVETILADTRLPQWQRVRLAWDYFHQIHRAQS
jgi:hypothetical protein